MKVIYHFPGFVLEFDTHTGAAITRYPDGKKSGCPPIPDDYLHGERLGIEASFHRVQHELAHHLVGLAMPEEGIVGCPIIRRDSLGQEHPQPDSEYREWRINAIQYHSLQKIHAPDQFGALMDLVKAGADPYELGWQLNELLNFIPSKGVNVTFED